KDGRGRAVRAAQHISGAIFDRELMRLVGRASPEVEHVGNLLAVAVIGPGDRIVMRDRDQPRPEVDEGEHEAPWLQRDRPQPPQRSAQIVGAADLLVARGRRGFGYLSDYERNNRARS